MNAFASTPVRRDTVLSPSGALWESGVKEIADQGAWQKFKEIFSQSLTGVATLINVREHFKTYFLEQTESLGQGISPQRQVSLLERGQQLLGEILEASLDQVMESAIFRNDGTFVRSELNKAVTQAQERADLAFSELQAQALRVRISDAPAFDFRPQIVVGADQGIRLIRSAPRIENLILRGGGAKGVCNGAMLIEMERAGLLSGLKQVVGTSVGALTAICLSSGQGAEGLMRVTANLKMSELINKPDNFDERYPSVNLNCRVGFHSGRALELLDQISASGVSNYLSQNWFSPAFQTRLEALRQTEGEAVVSRLKLLRNQHFQGDRTHQMITFRDLTYLHQLDPLAFKSLVLTGWDEVHKQVEYFSAANVPDMPIAVAGRISMSLPILFKAVTVDPGDHRGARRFTDGGVGSNMPTEAVTSGLLGDALAEVRARTAVMTFDENGHAYTVMHRPPEGRNRFIDWVLANVTGNPNFGRDASADDSKLKDMGSNAFVVFHGDISTLDLNASDERMLKARLQSSLKALEQIEQRQGQAYMVECENVSACFELLTDQEKKALIQGGPPNPAGYSGKTMDPAYRYQRQLYELAEQVATLARPWKTV